MVLAFDLPCQKRIIKRLNNKPKQKRTGHSWQVAIIWSVWSCWYLVWELWNHDLHRADEPSRAKANGEEVERSLREIYDAQAQMEPSVQTLLCKGHHIPFFKNN